MKRIAFIVEGYVKQSEANAICLKGIIDSLEEGVSADIISIESDISGWNENVFAINTSSCKIRSDILRKLIKFLHMPVGNRKITKLIAQKTNEILNVIPYDALIVVVNPVEAADAIKYIKKQNPRLIIILYEIDPASNRFKTPYSIIEKAWTYKSISWAQKVYRDCDAIIHMKTHKEHFQQKYFSAFDDISWFLDIPSFKVNILPNRKNNSIVMLYAGAFYPVLRNPFPMIEILKLLSQEISICVQIFTGSNMICDIRDSLRGYDMFSVNGYISQETLIKKYEEADFLLDLGNTNSDFLPSKPFQYMGTGKPIIHFQPDDNDVTIEYLKKYKKSLIVPTNIEKCNIREIVKFVENSRNSTESYTSEELLNVFHENTPAYTAKQLMEILYNVKENRFKA